LSHGWCWRVRPSSSHFTTASSSFVCSTVPNSPVGFPKLAKPMTRSPGFSSSSGAGGWTSGGLLARSASAVAPACNSGGCGALRSFGVSPLLRLIFHYPRGFAAPVHPRLHRAYRWKDGSADPNCTLLTTNLIWANWTNSRAGNSTEASDFGGSVGHAQMPDFVNSVPRARRRGFRYPET
jgi:hypothetical protein